MLYIIIYTVDPVLLLHGAIQSLLLDPGFNVPSPSAEAARITATILITYCGNPLSPPDLFSALARKLSSALACCFVSKQTIAFQLDWVKFVQESVKRTPSPVFCQYVTHEVFKCLIKEEYPVPDQDGNKNGESKEMTREEGIH